MALLIGFASNARKADAALADWAHDLGPDEAAFWFPREAEKGDTVAYFVGGTRQEFVAIGPVLAGWRRAGAGAWKGHEYLWTEAPSRLSPAVGAKEVDRLAGLAPPRDAGVVPAHLRTAVMAALRGRPFDAEARALEGARTESHSRRRDPRLRAAALQRAAGRCAGCDIDFTAVAGGLGRRCLVVHHTKQIRDLDEPAWTSVKDLVVLCANCHMIVHADPSQALTLKELRRALKA